MGKLASLLRHPTELSVRVQNKVASWRDRTSRHSTLAHVAGQDLARQCHDLFGGYFPEPGCVATLAALEAHIAAEMSRLREGPFMAEHNATSGLGRICYHAVRGLRPQIVVETGVAYGVTSAYILQALEDNGSGRLVSIDLPPLGLDQRRGAGALAPPHLRRRWELRLGPAQKLLPRVLHEHGPVDMFVHDSLHTYSHMRWEFGTALQALRPGGVLIADDISGNRAFEEMAEAGIGPWAALPQEGKESLYGILRRE